MAEKIANLVKSRNKLIGQIQKAPGVLLSPAQRMLNEMFNGNQMWGTGTCLPKVEGTLTSGNGLIKNDDMGETGRMFGLR
jgi:hypothetical protein